MHKTVSTSPIIFNLCMLIIGTRTVLAPCDRINRLSTTCENYGSTIREHWLSFIILNNLRINELPCYGHMIVSMSLAFCEARDTNRFHSEGYFVTASTCVSNFNLTRAIANNSWRPFSDSCSITALKSSHSDISASGVGYISTKSLTREHSPVVWGRG